MKLLYITTKVPYGEGEPFIFQELDIIRRKNISFLILPRNPGKNVYHGEGKLYLDNTLYSPLITLKMLIVCIHKILVNKELRALIWEINKNSRNKITLVKNLVVLPKSVYCSKSIKKEKITHIHVHWGATTATMAYILSSITGIPWSMTLHRGDIKQNNMLGLKVMHASFTRCISEHGKNMVRALVNPGVMEKIEVIHMGIEVDSNNYSIAGYNSLKTIKTIMVPAMLIPVKGHSYLIEACKILKENTKVKFECHFYGRGSCSSGLSDMIVNLGLRDTVFIHDPLPHEQLIELYKNKDIDLVVLPSINTDTGEHEGIPVSLMEAMSYGIPVISTKTGGIPELLSDDAGILVDEKSPEQLAEAIERVLMDETVFIKLSRNGFTRVNDDFNIAKSMERLINKCMDYNLR